MSFTAYCESVRLREAERLLLTTDRDITLIAAEAGFSTTSYFIERFRIAYGTTPRAFRQNVKSSHEGWLIDKNGVPTQDPSEYLKGGILIPFGGYKGYGLAIMVELFGALLSGAAMTKDVHAWNAEPDTNGNVGHFFMALDISKLGDPMEYRLRTDALIDEIKSAKKADGVEVIYYPGEIEQKKMAACLECGYVDIADETMEAVARTEAALGLF